MFLAAGQWALPRVAMMVVVDDVPLKSWLLFAAAISQYGLVLLTEKRRGAAAFVHQIAI